MAATRLIRGFSRNFAAGLVGPFRLLAEQRSLLRVLIKRDVAVQTSGTVLGGLWLLAQPSLQVLALWFLLDFVLRVRFPGEVSFVAYFLLGMLPWTMISVVIQRNLMILTEFSALYQRTVFPIRLLPLLPLIITGLIYGIIFPIVVGVTVGWAASLPALALVVGLLVWVLPLSYLVAVFGLFVRDLRQIVPFLLTMGLYITPVMYMPEMLPERMRAWLVLNPFADLMAVIHAVLQNMPLTAGNIVRPLLLWALLLAPAWALFHRAEPHMREEL